MMKFKNIAGFLAGLLLFLLFFSWLFEPKNNTVKSGVDERNDNAYGILAEPENSIDAVVIGDSLCYTGISPLTMWEKNGIASYNCGRTAQRMSEAYYMLKRVYKTQAPKLVVIESNMLFWPNDIEGQINQVLFEAAEYYFPVFEYHNQWKKFDMKDFDDVDYENRKNDKGFHMKKEVQAYTGGTYMKETTAAEGVAGMERLLLKQMIRLCKSRGSEVLLLSVPSPKDYTYEKHNAVQNLADACGADYLDLNLLADEIGIDWNQDILDGFEHLNVYGAEKVSAYLGNYLSGQYGLTDHSADAAYSSWNDCLEKYKKEMEDTVSAQ